MSTITKTLTRSSATAKLKSKGFTLLPLAGGSKCPPKGETYACVNGDQAACIENIDNIWSRYVDKISAKMGTDWLYEVGLMTCGDVCCIDFDDMCEYKALMEENTALADFLALCPKEYTSRGLHYFMLDSAPSLKSSNGLYSKHIDFCKITNTGTPHIVKVYPSQGRRLGDLNLYNTALLEIPHDIVSWLSEGINYKTRQNTLAQQTERDEPDTVSAIPDEYKKLLDLVNKNDYDTWYKMGMIFKKSGWGLNAWVLWSKDAANYDPTVMTAHWEGFKNIRLTASRIHDFARQGNPTVYDDITKNDLHTKCKQVVNGDATDYDLAMLLKSYFPTARTTCLKGEKEIYITNDENRWIQLTPAILVDLMGNILASKFNDLYLSLIDTDEKKANKARDIRIKLKTTKNQAAILTQFSQLTYDKFFLMKLDEKNRHLMGFDNGVYDFNAGKFRPYELDDYVSLSTGYDYPVSCNPKAREHLLDFLRSVFGYDDDNKRGTDTLEYVIASIASCMNGDTRFEDIYVWTGDSGRNGKGCLCDLVESVFGDYFKMMDISVITKGRQGGQATPELAMAKSRRFVALTEPDACDALQVAILKRLRGGDVIECRQLHQNPIQMKPQFRLYLQTNGIPKLSVPDRAIEQTMKAIPFEYEFCSKDEYNKWVNNAGASVMKYKKIGKPSVKKRCKDSTQWRDAFLFLLIDTYNRVVRKAINDDNSSIPIPEAVKQTTEDYMDEQNYIKDYLETWTTKHTDDDPTHRVKLNELVEHFNEQQEGFRVGKKKMREWLKFAKIDVSKTRVGVMCMGLTINSSAAKVDIEDSPTASTQEHGARGVVFKTCNSEIMFTIQNCSVNRQGDDTSFSAYCPSCAHDLYKTPCYTHRIIARTSYVKEDLYKGEARIINPPTHYQGQLIIEKVWRNREPSGLRIEVTNSATFASPKVGRKVVRRKKIIPSSSSSQTTPFVPSV